MGPPGNSSGGNPGEFALFYQPDNAATASQGGAVLITQTAASSGGISLEEGAVHLPGNGVYRLLYLVNFPVASRVNTVLTLRLGDGSVLPGSSCHVDKENPGQPYTAAGQAIVETSGEGAVLTLNSFRSFNIAGAASGDTLVSLLVEKLR